MAVEAAIVVATGFKKIFQLCTVTSGILLTEYTLAGPPYQTDDPEPVGVGGYEMFFAYELARTADGKSSTLPSLELNYGAAPDIQIGIGLPVEWNEPNHDASHHGLGDMELSLKYRFMHEGSDHPMVAFFPMIAVPTGDADKELGNGQVQYFLPLWLQKNWGDWQTNAGGGYWINHASGAINHWYFGWQLQKQITERFTLGGEIYRSTEEAAGDGDSSGFNLGTTYAFNDNNHIMFSAGRGLDNVDKTNQLSSYIGYQLTW